MQRLALLAWVAQEAFQRDRNLHAELLLQCIEEGRWKEPLDRHPPPGPLLMLPPHIACSLRRRRHERHEISREASATSSTVCGSTNTSTSVRSLASAAVAAVGHAPTRGADGGASAPLAYATLAARVAHLQEENKFFRRELRQARSASSGHLRTQVQHQSSIPQRRRKSCGISWGRGAFAREGSCSTTHSPSSTSQAVSSCQQSRDRDRHCSHRGENEYFTCRASCQEDLAEAPSMRRCGSPQRRSQSPLRASVTFGPSDLEPSSILRPMQETSISRESVCAILATGEHHSEVLEYSPPDGDKEDFLRRLDEFQVRAERLCAVRSSA